MISDPQYHKSMKRKDFLRKTALGLALGGLGFAAKGSASATSSEAIENASKDAANTNTMKETQYVLHPALSRGKADHGWLKSFHSFSFAQYHNPKKMNFGLLRVLNDDQVAPGKGFGTHPHDNMEIVSIPLHGDLEHKDSMGNTSVIRQGDVQIMSAGTGVFHSEYNKNDNDEVKFLQIWVFPKERNIEPRYDQKSYPVAQRKNQLKTVVAPDDGDAVWINQDAWFSLGNFDAGKSQRYRIQKPGNGVYAFLLKGKAEIDGHSLSTRDAIGVWDTDEINISFSDDSELLLIDVPMSWG